MKWLSAFFLLLPFLAGAQLKTDFKKPGAPIPPFTIEQTDGKILTNKSLKAGKSSVIMIFSPECEHCAQMIDTLKGMVGNLKKSQLMLVTEARNKDALKGFIEKHELNKYPAFQQIGWDKENLVYYIYSFQVLPQVNVYSSNHKLMRTFTGAFSLDSLRQYLD